jgi:hypothetical protein
VSRGAEARAARLPQVWAWQAARRRIARAHAQQQLSGVVLLAWRDAAQRRVQLRLGVQQLQRSWAGRQAELALQAWADWAQQQRSHKLAAVALAAADR